MKAINFLFVGLIACLILSCSKDEINESPVEIDYEYFRGSYWENPVIQDTLWQFDRTNKLHNNTYRLSLLIDNQVIERKGSGWCGTPPIAYSDFEGHWNLHGDTLSITVGYWGGTAQYEWKIISVSNNHLVVYKLSEVYSEPFNYMD